MRFIFKNCAVFILLVGLTSFAATQTPSRDIPKHGREAFSFNGRDLSQFDSFIPERGLDSDPNQVFKVENGLIHISGREIGYIISKQEYKNYYLRAEFKWGDGTFGSHVGKGRDSGILFNIQGENKVWPRSVEFQIDEGCTGDFWITDGAALTELDGVRVTGPAGKATKIDRLDKGPVENVTGFRDPKNELENPHGDWNLVELVNRGDGHIWQYVNGKLANEATDAFPSGGKILFQAEGAEVFFRNIKLYPLK